MTQGVYGSVANFVTDFASTSVKACLGKNEQMISNLFSLSATYAKASCKALANGRISTFARCGAVSALFLTLTATQTAASVVFSCPKPDNGMFEEISSHFQYMNIGRLQKVEWLTATGDSSVCIGNRTHSDCADIVFGEPYTIPFLTFEGGEVVCPIDELGIAYPAFCTPGFFRW